MATTKNRFAIVLNDQIYDEVIKYQKKRGMKVKTQAAVDLIRLGLIYAEQLEKKIKSDK